MIRQSDWGEGRLGVLAQRGEARLLQVVAVEKVVGVEGDEAAVGVDDVDAGFLDAAYVERVGVDELHDDDAEDVFVGDVVGDEDFGKTAEKLRRVPAPLRGEWLVAKSLKRLVRTAGSCS